MSNEPQKIPVLSNVGAIRDFFKASGKPIDLEEIKALDSEDRKELGQLCREALAEKK